MYSSISLPLFLKTCEQIKAKVADRTGIAPFTLRHLSVSVHEYVVNNHMRINEPHYRQGKPHTQYVSLMTTAEWILRTPEHQAALARRLSEYGYSGGISSRLFLLSLAYGIMESVGKRWEIALHGKQVQPRYDEHLQALVCVGELMSLADTMAMRLDLIRIRRFVAELLTKFRQKLPVKV